MPWNEIADRLVTLRYSEEDGHGVIIHSVSRDDIKGTFFEKTTYTEIINHPLQGQTEQVGTTYFATKFSIHRESGLLNILTLLRRYNSLLTFLSLRLGSLSVSEIKIDTLLFCKFASGILKNFKTKRITVSNFNITDKSKATLSITSTDDALDELSKINLNIPHRPSKLYFEGFALSKKISGSVHSNGVFSLSDINCDYVIDAIISSPKSFVIKDSAHFNSD